MSGVDFASDFPKEGHAICLRHSSQVHPNFMIKVRKLTLLFTLHLYIRPTCTLAVISLEFRIPLFSLFMYL